jgi:hypothetical protein
VGWDEYYPDGSPVTLNWELVVNGLARVYTETLNLIKGSALIDPSKAIPIPKEVRASDETRPLYWQRTGINSPMNPAKY